MESYKTGLGEAMPVTRRERTIATILKEDPSSYLANMTLLVEFAVPSPKTPTQPGNAATTATGSRSGLSPSTASPASGRRSKAPRSAATPAPSMHNRLKDTTYIHYEFAPYHDHLVTKTDLVAHDIVGAPPKVFTDQDARTCEVKEDGDLRWIGWRHGFNVGVNMDMCNEIFDEGLNLDVWETKDRVSSRARFDKPKPVVDKPTTSSATSSSSANDGAHERNSKQGTLRQTRKSKRASVIPRDRTTGRTSTQFGHRHSSPSRDGRRSVVDGDDGGGGDGYGGGGGGDGDGDGGHSAFELPPGTADAGSVGLGLGGATVELGLAGSDEAEGPTIADKILTNTVTRVRGANAVDKDAPGTKVTVSLTDFFAGDQKVVYLLEDASTIGLNKIKQVRITVMLDRPMLSDAYARTLNPLVLKFLDARALPSTPVSYKELDSKCVQSTVEFTAFRGEKRRIVSKNKKHGELQVWDQKHVVMTNRFTFEEMVRFLKEPIPIEVHDRDRVVHTGLPTTALFDSTKPELFNDFWRAVGHSKTANVLEDVAAQWDPYGVAKLDLSDLLSGVKSTEYEMPILSGPRMSGLKVTEASAGAMHAGHYVEKGAALTVNVTLFRPITSLQTRKSYVAAPSERGSIVQSRMHRSFGRAVYLWNGPHHEFFDRLKTFVDTSNIGTLQLDTLDLANVQLALQSYDLTDEQQRDGNLDILTGFQLATPTMRVAVVEGLSQGKLEELRKVMGHPTDPGFRSLFDSSESHLERLYGPLGPALASVCVAESLEELGQRSEIYVKGGRGWGCLTGLSQIQALFIAAQMKVAIRDDLLPSSTSILTISSAYGEAPTHAMAPTSVSAATAAAAAAGGGDGGEASYSSGDGNGEISATIPMSKFNNSTVTNLRASLKNATARIDTTNQEYDDFMVTQQQEPDTNFLAKNTGIVANTSAANTVRASERRRLNETITQHAGEAVHNYSTSTFNSSVLAQERMRLMILDDIRTGRRPKALYTYDVTGEFHHSAASAVMAPNAPGPGQMDAAATLKRRDDPEKWMTSGGLDTTARNVVDLARQHADPDAPWESKTFVDILSTGREPFPWELREKDFDNLTRKPPNAHSVTEYGLVDQTARQQPTVAIVGGTTKPRDFVQGQERWKSTPLSREPPSVPRLLLEQYSDTQVARNAMGDGSMLHATRTATVPIDVQGPRLTLVHNNRTAESVGRHFHKNRK